MKEMHAKIIEAIKGFYMEKGFGPTVRQIGEMVGLKSTSSVQSHLENMEHLGLIVRGEFSVPRSIRIPGFNYSPGNSDNKDGAFCNENSIFRNDSEKNERQNGIPGTVFVLHGFWTTSDDAGVDVFGVSPDIEMLRERMKDVGNQLLADAKNNAGFEVRDKSIVFDKYEVEGDCGDMIRLYITEHNIENKPKEV